MKEPSKEKKSNGIMLPLFLVSFFLVTLFDGYIPCILILKAKKKEGFPGLRNSYRNPALDSK